MKYLITSKKAEASAKLIISYNEAGVLLSVELENCTPVQAEWLLQRVPVLQALLLQRCDHFNLNWKQVDEDLSFDRFWRVFDYKVGKKPRATRLWEAMTKIERALALVAIPKYKRFIANKNQESAYPETWLSNRMWENEYKGV